MTISRNEKGYSSLLASDPLGYFNFNDPINFPRWMDDFLAYDLTQAQGTNYTFTQTNGSDTLEGPTGVVKLLCAGADNDLVQLQLTEPSIATNSKQLWFDCKVSLTLASAGTIAANELFFGLSSDQQGTNFFAADGLSLAMDDALGFYKLDAEASLTAISRENDSQSIIPSVVTPTTGTYMRLSVYYDGGTAHFYHNGSLVGSLSGVDVTSTLTPCLYLKAGEAKANYIKCDYLFMGSKR